MGGSGELNGRSGNLGLYGDQVRIGLSLAFLVDLSVDFLVDSRPL